MPSEVIKYFFKYHKYSVSNKMNGKYTNSRKVKENLLDSDRIWVHYDDGGGGVVDKVCGGEVDCWWILPVSAVQILANGFSVVYWSTWATPSIINKVGNN